MIIKFQYIIFDSIFLIFFSDKFFWTSFKFHQSFQKFLFLKGKFLMILPINYVENNIIINIRDVVWHKCRWPILAFEATKKQILIFFVSDESFDSSYYIFGSRLKIQPCRTTLCIASTKHLNDFCPCHNLKYYLIIKQLTKLCVQCS